MEAEVVAPMEVTVAETAAAPAAMVAAAMRQRLRQWRHDARQGGQGGGIALMVVPILELGLGLLVECKDTTM